MNYYFLFKYLQITRFIYNEQELFSAREKFVNEMKFSIKCYAILKVRNTVSNKFK